MKKTTKKVRVDRKRWLRGGINPKGNNTTSMLCNDDGCRCCLGFALGQLHRITKAGMINLGHPEDVLNKPDGIFTTTVLLNVGDIVNTRFTEQCIDINDNDGISDKMREYKLKRKFASQGIELEFYN